MRHGFGDEAVELAYQMPYVTEVDYMLNYETGPLCYLIRAEEEIAQGEYDEKVEEEGEFEWDFAKDPTYQERDDHHIGRKVLVLTRGNVHGFELIYDLERSMYYPALFAVLVRIPPRLGSDAATGTITQWQHFEEEDWKDVPGYSMASPQNPLYVWIRSFLTLQNIPFGSDIILDRTLEGHAYPGDDADEDQMRQWRERVKAHFVERRLKDVYVQYGWNIDAVNQLGIGSEDSAGAQEQENIGQLLEQARQMASARFRGAEFQNMRDRPGLFEHLRSLQDSLTIAEGS